MIKKIFRHQRTQKCLAHFVQAGFKKILVLRKPHMIKLVKGINLIIYSALSIFIHVQMFFGNSCFYFFIMAISRFTYDSKTKVLTIPENNKSFYVGKFELLNPADIRQRLADSPPQFKGNITLDTIQADVGNLHRNPKNKNAVFQAASQVRSKKHL